MALILQAIAVVSCLETEWPVLIVVPSSLRLQWAAVSLTFPLYHSPWVFKCFALQKFEKKQIFTMAHDVLHWLVCTIWVYGACC